MLAKAVAHHTTASFIRVVGSEFVQKYLGEVRGARRRLRVHAAGESMLRLCRMLWSLSTRRRLHVYSMLCGRCAVEQAVVAAGGAGCAARGACRGCSGRRRLLVVAAAGVGQACLCVAAALRQGSRWLRAAAAAALQPAAPQSGRYALVPSAPAAPSSSGTSTPPALFQFPTLPHPSPTPPNPQGPRMVRDVFRLAKENAPSIIFIDEVGGGGLVS